MTRIQAIKRAEECLGWAKFNEEKSKEEAVETLLTHAIFSLQKVVNTDAVITKMYYAFKVKPTDTGIQAAIEAHTETCKNVANYFQISIDDVAKAVKNESKI